MHEEFTDVSLFMMEKYTVLTNPLVGKAMWLIPHAETVGFVYKMF